MFTILEIIHYFLKYIYIYLKKNNKNFIIFYIYNAYEINFLI